MKEPAITPNTAATPKLIVDPVNVDVGGLLAKSGIAIPEMGDVDEEGRPNDDFVIAVASITVGY